MVRGIAGIVGGFQISSAEALIGRGRGHIRLLLTILLWRQQMGEERTGSWTLICALGRRRARGVKLAIVRRALR